jgi:hypothetical protein
MMGNEQGGMGRYKKGQETLKDYVIKQFIVANQYAWVYKVENPIRVRALKVFKKRLDRDSQEVKDDSRGVRFIRNVQSLFVSINSTISHTNS